MTLSALKGDLQIKSIIFIAITIIIIKTDTCPARLCSRDLVFRIQEPRRNRRRAAAPPSVQRQIFSLKPVFFSFLFFTCRQKRQSCARVEKNSRKCNYLSAVLRSSDATLRFNHSLLPSPHRFHYSQEEQGLVWVMM